MPHRSCDLTPLNYFLWDYAKAHADTDKPASIDELEDNIEVFIQIQHIRVVKPKVLWLEIPWY